MLDRPEREVESPFGQIGGIAKYESLDNYLMIRCKTAQQHPEYFSILIRVGEIPLRCSLRD
jgi:hypothetical protein